ncbi:hypothetical protein BC332_15478 [Capsicum chinense]|nr:hypothetical protein BC332_15478 [Capsicum chinense]
METILALLDALSRDLARNEIESDEIEGQSQEGEEAEGQNEDVRSETYCHYALGYKIPRVKNKHVIPSLFQARLGIRLWSYVREEASYGRGALIDLFTQKCCKPSAFQGVPLGEIGSGSISRGFRGEFKHFQILPGTWRLLQSWPISSQKVGLIRIFHQQMNHSSIKGMQIKSANAKGVISLQHTKPDAEEIDEDSDTNSGGEMVHGILTSGTKSHI